MKYLFQAHFADGSSITQTPEDISTLIPTKSAFYDVLQREDDLISFGLFAAGHTYAVDLTDGHFEVDHNPFAAQDPRTKLDPSSKFRLIYFRKVRRAFNTDLEELGVDTDRK